MRPTSDLSVRLVDLHWEDSPAHGIVGAPRPRLRWRLTADRPDVRQTGYEMQISPDESFGEVVADSGVVPSTTPFGARWVGPDLASREVRFVRVRAHTDRGITAWSAPRRVEGALLSPEDWSARPISTVANAGHPDSPAMLLRRAFRRDTPIEAARLYVTALGVFRIWVNGELVSDAQLDPGWTAYQARLLYAAHDVTALLRSGENVVAAMVGEGWWRGRLGWAGARAVYGDTTALLAQLEMRDAGGAVAVLGTDATWRGTASGVASADLYDGAVHDLRHDPGEGWTRTGFDDSSWSDVIALAPPKGLELRPMPPIEIVRSWPARSTRADDGRVLVDAGQNLAGYVRVSVRGAAGARITVRHAEVLTPQGGLHTALLRSAKATDTCTLADDRPVTIEPVFTFHGFRYAEVACDPRVTIESVEICALSSAVREIGRFECSDARLNRLFSNVAWSQRSNFLSLPTDCPQRDERMGWTGDIQVFAPTACANADVRAFLSSWLKDLAIEQRADGCVTSTVPNVIQGHAFEYGGVGWGDAATLVPWALYEAFGDLGVLERQFSSMRAWVDYCASRRGPDGLWRGDFQLGDWLDPGAPSDMPFKATTDGDFIANAYLARSAGVVASAAALLGRAAEAEHYRQLREAVANAAWDCWRDHALGTQAGCAMAIEFAIAPPQDRVVAGDRLEALVAKSGGRIATGFLGTPLVLPALTRMGKIEAAYRVLLNEDCPGWLYQVKLGATTMWERWDAVRPDGTIHPGDMSGGGSMMSFNHYAYGAVAAWLYRSVAGLAPDASEPGYGLVVFAPQPGGGLRFARASMDTPYGLSGIDWEEQDDRLRVALTVAPGARGRFEPPSGWRLDSFNGGVPGAGPAIALGSGSYECLLSRTARRPPGNL